MNDKAKGMVADLEGDKNFRRAEKDNDQHWLHKKDKWPYGLNNAHNIWKRDHGLLWWQQNELEERSDDTVADIMARKL